MFRVSFNVQCSGFQDLGLRVRFPILTSLNFLRTSLFLWLSEGHFAQAPRNFVPGNVVWLVLDRRHVAHGVNRYA